MLLMVDGSTGTGPAVSAAVSRRGEVSRVRFFGGSLSISQAARTNIVAALTNASTRKFAVTLDKLRDAQVQSISSISSWTEEFRNKQISLLPKVLNPLSASYGNPEFYQFARLDSGYTGLSADLINGYISTHGSDGKLANQGVAFVDASKSTGLSEVYLLSHAILESGWGKSALAKGFEYNGEDLVGGSVYPKGTYYNFYGIGAVDSGPLSGGRALAVKMGWDSPYKAIVGAAKWIKENYVGRSQNTLYLMKWNPVAVAFDGKASHQYATDVEWAYKISRVMSGVASHSGRSQLSCGMKFELPAFM